MIPTTRWFQKEPLTTPGMAITLGQNLADHTHWIRVREIVDLDRAILNLVQLGARRVQVETAGDWQDERGNSVFGHCRVTSWKRVTATATVDGRSVKLRPTTRYTSDPGYFVIYWSFEL